MEAPDSGPAFVVGSAVWHRPREWSQSREGVQHSETERVGVPRVPCHISIHFTFHIYSALEIQWTWYIHVHTASLQSGRPLVAASVTRLSTCLRDFFCIGNEIRHFEITFEIHDF